jgi:glycosyltransferase involved in cell wall biosynthesis
MSPPSRAPHILMTTDAVGGVWVFATTLAAMLCRSGARVSLVTLGPHPREEQLRPLRTIAGLHVECTDLALEWMDPEGNDVPRARRELAKIERRLKPDLIHLNSYREACGKWAAPVVVTAHSCVRSWWRACRGDEPAEPRWHTYFGNVAAGLVAADVWTAPTAAFGNTIRMLYAPPERGYVVRNGIDAFPPPSRKEHVILAAGRLWDEAKNVAILGAAARGLDWPVLVAGSPQLSDSTNRARLDASAVESLGEIDRPQLLAHMRRAGIFAAPALYEPFGLTVLEAAAAGCALVLADIPSFRELWQGAALFVDPHDEQALHATLQTLCRDSALRALLSRAGRRHARRYTAADMAGSYGVLYEKVTAAAPHPRLEPEMGREMRA